jgi:CheY-like chemotaxis protein
VTDILIVEDHPTMRSAMRAVLQTSGYELREAADGPGALQAIQERVPDVMFLDLHMPGVSGEDVLRQIKENPATAGIKIIVVTAQGEDIKKRVFELGADAYFQKPYSPEGLLQAVEDVLSGAPEAPAVPAEEPEGSASPDDEPDDPGYDPLFPGAFR